MMVFVEEIYNLGSSQTMLHEISGTIQCLIYISLLVCLLHQERDFYV